MVRRGAYNPPSDKVKLRRSALVSIIPKMGLLPVVYLLPDHLLTVIQMHDGFLFGYL